MTLTKAKMAAVLCGLSMAGAGILSGGAHTFNAPHVAAGTIQTTATPTAGQNQSATPATAQPKITIEKALEIARGQAQGDVTELELEMDNGVLTYKVHVGSAKVYINAEDGAVIQVKTKDSSETLPQAKIPIEKAIEIAKGSAQGDFHSADLEMKDGVLVWDVEIGDSEVYVNADDGTVVKVQTGESDHEDDEDNGDSDHNDSDHNDSDHNDQSGNDSQDSTESAALPGAASGQA